MRYQPGETVAGFHVTAILTCSRDHGKHRYAGIWDCCDAPAEISHKYLLRRIKLGRVECPDCRPRAIQLKPYGVTCPTWPPLSASALPRF